MVRSRATVLVAVLALGAGVAGCGSGGDGESDDVPTITTRPSSSAAEESTPPEPTSTPTEPTGASTSATEPAASTSSAPGPTGTPTATHDSGRGPTTYRAAVARVDQVLATSGDPLALTRFSGPRDVYCLLDDPVIGPSCELATGFIEDEAYCGAGIEGGIGRIETIDGRAQPVCNTDTIREPGARVVSPQGVVVAGPAVCAVEQVGITCIDRDAATGFFLTPGEYHVFSG